ncbi:unnamed protein product [Euphydryas editha]|uniref:Pre-C2HC domain-containing protein n=1 Tax=Euphydryas editha TaxID=104508 RepID=A0AAU9TIQ6_EUPED|nr:unnamed protein product [Euphydryas editha]
MSNKRITKKPLPMHFIEVESNNNNKDIYNIKSLLHCRVIFEPQRPKRDIPQCSNCQQYGYTRKYCFRKIKCIKCAGDDASSKCERKERSNSVKCILCDGNHPANYKSCAVYKELQRIKYPTQPGKHRQTTRPVHRPNHAETTARQQDQPSYKQVLMSNKSQHPSLPAKQQSPNESTEVQTNSNDMKVIMNTMSLKLTNSTTIHNDKSPIGNHDQTDKFCPLKIALWNANGLSQHVLEVETFLKINKIAILLVSETHFTNKNYLRINNYKFYQTMHLDCTTLGGSAIIIKSNIKHYETEPFRTPKIQATSVVVEDWRGHLTVTALYSPPKHVIKKKNTSTSSKPCDQKPGTPGAAGVPYLTLHHEPLYLLVKTA